MHLSYLEKTVILPSLLYNFILVMHVHILLRDVLKCENLGITDFTSCFIGTNPQVVSLVGYNVPIALLMKVSNSLKTQNFHTQIVNQWEPID